MINWKAAAGEWLLFVLVVGVLLTVDTLWATGRTSEDWLSVARTVMITSLVMFVVVVTRRIREARSTAGGDRGGERSGPNGQ